MERCCFLWSLRSGTLALLWISAIGNILAIFIYGSALKFIDIFDSIFDSILDDSSVWEIYFIEFLKKFIPIISILRKGIIYFIIFLIAIVLTGFITAVLGIYGINNNKAKYLTPNLYHAGFRILLLSIAVALNLIISLWFGSKENRKDFDLGGLLLSLAYIALETYFFVVIRTLRNSMLRRSAVNTRVAFSRAPRAY